MRETKSEMAQQTRTTQPMTWALLLFNGSGGCLAAKWDEKEGCVMYLNSVSQLAQLGVPQNCVIKTEMKELLGVNPEWEKYHEAFDSTFIEYVENDYERYVITCITKDMYDEYIKPHIKSERQDLNNQEFTIKSHQEWFHCMTR